MPEINDLRSFIDVLEENGQLATISQEVSINHEIADITASLARSDGGAAFFNNVKKKDADLCWRSFIAQKDSIGFRVRAGIDH